MLFQCSCLIQPNIHLYVCISYYYNFMYLRWSYLYRVFYNSLCFVFPISCIFLAHRFPSSPGAFVISLNLIFPAVFLRLFFSILCYSNCALRVTSEGGSQDYRGTAFISQGLRVSCPPRGCHWPQLLMRQMPLLGPLGNLRSTC